MMKVSEIMVRIIHTIPTDATLEQASHQLRDENIGFLAVVEESVLADANVSGDIVKDTGPLPLAEMAVLVGALTDRDVIVRAIASGMDPRTTLVSEIMSRDVAVCHQDDGTTEAAAVMERKKVRRLFVLNREERPVGVLSLDDISAVDTRLAGETLKAITE